MKGKNRLLFSFLILTPILIMFNGCSLTQAGAFLVTWKNYDGNILKEEKYNYGEMPSYKGAVPTKPDTTEHSYTFSSWSPTIEKVTCNKVYTANFDETARKYEIKWYNGATCLETDEVEYGIVPKYKGLTPQRSSDPQYDYSFSGWSPIVTKVTGPVNYYAQFSTATRSYQIIWQDDEGKELKKETLPYGTTPKYDDIPIKQSTAQYSYTFSGWSPSITTVTGPAIYKANFSPTIRSYDIVFKNGDKILQSENLKYGVTPTYKGDTPTKSSPDEYHIYKFAGWSPTISVVTGSATYNAMFEKVGKKYTITWKMDDGTTLKTDQVEYDKMPDYGNPPTKKSTAQYDYTFTGWSPSVTKVTGPATYVATFSSVVRSYDIVFKNGDIILQSENLKYGATPTYKGDIPTKSSPDKYHTYEFSGWSPSVTKVTGPATYIAQFNHYFVFGRYPQSKVTNASLIDSLNKKSGTIPTSSHSYNWIPYDYYIDSSSNTKFMWYIDIDYNNDKYRGVYFDQYRPIDICLPSTIFNTYQHSNGYDIKTRYWFKYEPIKWKILSSSTNDDYIMSNMLLDSQQYYIYAENNKTRERTDYQGNVGNVYDNNYKFSDLRTFLNTTFYNIAFNDNDKNIIKTTTVDNSSLTTEKSKENPYSCGPTKDKIFTLSYADVKNWKAEDRRLKSTDYAKCQGISCNLSEFGSYGDWQLRSPCGSSSFHASYVSEVAALSNSMVTGTYHGLVPILHINKT